MDPQVVVNLDHCSYPIYVQSGLLAHCGEYVPADASQVIVITDHLVDELYGEQLDLTLSNRKAATSFFVITAGEQSKSIRSYEDLLARMLAAGADRHAIVIALGGGVVGDLAGFVAATYKRGVRLVQIPTTLLAQVDSSVGGKVGINLPLAKNSVGAFWQPAAVIIDPSTLASLDDDNYAAGLSEVVKYGVIMDAEFFQFLESSVDLIRKRDSKTLETIIARCCQLKAEIVAEDERETSGRRAILNYGHTFAHAIESSFGYGQYLHGQAVGIGMVAAARLAELLNRVDPNFVKRQTDLLERLNVPTAFPSEKHDEILVAMQRDKKNTGEQIRFVLPTRLGHVELVSSIDEQFIRKAMTTE